MLLSRASAATIFAVAITTSSMTFAQALSTARTSPAFAWQIKEPFPLIGSDFDRLASLAEMDRPSAKALYGALAGRWRPGRPIVSDPDATRYNNASGKYQPGYVLRAGDPVLAQFRLREPTAHNWTCRWRLESINGPWSARGLCDAWASLEVLVDEVVTVNVEVTERVDLAPSTHSFPVHARQKVIVAMGDSYASGEGNPDIPATYGDWRGDGSLFADWMFDSRAKSIVGHPVRWWDKECHRSLVSWPVLSALSRALSDDTRHTRYALLTYACSGAELWNGIFFAQLNPPGQARQRLARRDGEPLWFDSSPSLRRDLVARSQVNALFDDLCAGQSRRIRQEEVHGSGGRSVMVDDCTNPIPVDELHLSIGGNEIGFAGIAMGVLVPEQARTKLLSPLLLKLFRAVMGTASLEEAKENVNKLASSYALQLTGLLRILGVSADRTTLVAYPDPIGSDSTGCDRFEGEPNHLASGRARIRDSNLILGSVLPRLAFGIGSGWTVEVARDEVASFQRLFADLSDMQHSVRSHGIALATYGTDQDFVGRQVCNMQPRVEGPVMPLHFCGTSAECNLCGADGFDATWCPVAPKAWRHYGGKPKRLVYFLNDSILALRPWTGIDPSGQDLQEALKGSMHPTAEAHAAAAEAVNRCLQASEDCRAMPLSASVAP